MLDQNTLEKLKKALSKQPIKFAYLYGSYARGQEHLKSDLDIAIVMEENSKKADYEIGGSIQSELGTGFPKTETREISLGSEPIFLRSVLKDKIVLYSKNEKERVSFEVSAMKKFYDTQHLRDLNFYYLNKSIKEGNYGHRPSNFTKLA